MSKCALIFSCLVTASIVNAAVLIDRGLPNAGTVNNIAGAGRSNVDWSFPAPTVPPFLGGDSFVVPNDAPSYNITSIMVFITSTTNPFTEFDDTFALYGGLASNPASFGLIPTLTSISRVYYPGSGNLSDACITGAGVNYQDQTGDCHPIYSLTFAVNLHLNAGDVFNFAVGATSQLGDCDANTPGNCLFLHASNAALSLTPQQGSDGVMLVYDPLDLGAGPYTFNSAPCPANGEDICGGFDKESDINLVVQGVATPEPSTYALFLVGAGLMYLRRRKS